jgi:hypothetical protein
VLDAFFKAFGKRWAVSYSADGSIEALAGMPSVPVSADGREMIELLSRLNRGQSPHFATVPRETHLGPLRLFRYQQSIDADRRLEIKNAEIIIVRSIDGGPIDIILNPAILAVNGTRRRSLQSTEAVRIPQVVLSPNQARSIVLNAVERDLESLPKRADAVIDIEIPTPMLFMYHHALYIAYVARSKAYVRDETGETILALREYVVDAGRHPDLGSPFIVVKNLIRHYTEGTAEIFDPNPMSDLSSFLTDFPYPGAPYRSRPLCDLDDADSNGTYGLGGKYVDVTGSGFPSGPTERLATPDFSMPRGSLTFAAANAYFHIDRMQRWIEFLGFEDSVRFGLAVDVNGGTTQNWPNGEFIEDGLNTSARAWFSLVKPNNVYAAEDGDIVAHEYGHSLLQKKTEGRFQISEQKKNWSEAEAINEGFADYWAWSSSSWQKRAPGFSPDCLEEWAALGRCIRRYASVSHRLYCAKNDIYVNGQIWSGILYEILMRVQQERRVADSIIVGGQMERSLAGSAPTMRSMAEGIVIADGRKFGGVHRDELCAIFRRHGLKLACCKSAACVAR